jgi:hypothetical protein
VEVYRGARGGGAEEGGWSLSRLFMFASWPGAFALEENAPRTLRFTRLRVFQSSWLKENICTLSKKVDTSLCFIHDGKMYQG